MTSGGNTKQRFCVWAAVAFFIISMLCAVEVNTGGDDVYRALAMVTLALGLISLAGIWANGLPKSPDA